MEGMKVFNYNDTPITFDTAAATGTMVNATEMAKPFKKQPIDWLKTNQSKEYLDVFSKLKFFSLADLVQVKKGGNNSGT